MLKPAGFCMVGGGCEYCWGRLCDAFQAREDATNVLALPSPTSKEPPPVVTKIKTEVKFKELKR